MLTVDKNKLSRSVFETDSIPLSNPPLSFRDESNYQAALAKHREGDINGAEFLYRQILTQNPIHVGSLHFLGVILLARKQWDESLEYLERSLKLCNTKAVFYNNYGAVLREVGRFDEAKTAFIKAIELDPNYADAYSNLGLVAFLQNNLDEAEQHLRNALELKNDHTDAKRHLGETHVRQGIEFTRHRQFLKAQEQFERAVLLVPDDPMAVLSLGASLGDQGKLQEAESAFIKASSFPTGRKIWSYKRLGLCPSVFEGEAAIEEYWETLNSELDRVLDTPPPMDWKTLPQDGFIPSFNIPHLNRCCRLIKEKFSSLYQKAFPQSRPDYSPKDRIRIGFVVTEGHELGFKRVMDGIVNGLNRDRFEVKLFCPAKNVSLFHNPIPFSDRLELAVETLRSHQCDILYHWKVGGGHFDYFLPFARTAPVQCTGFGTHGTSGVAAVDHYISSSFLEVPEADSHYTESLDRLQTYSTYHTKLAKPMNVKRSEFPVPEKGTLYFCPHRVPKYHPMFDTYFKEILEQDSTSTLLLLVGNQDLPREQLQSRLHRQLGKSLMNRIIFFTALPVELYYRLLAMSDVVLDSPVYSGDLTTHDAFSFGIPVVTQRGSLLVQRYTAGLYDLIGISELTAKDQEHYVNIAVRLGTDNEYRRSISREIETHHGILFDDRRIVQDFEQFAKTCCMGASFR